MKINNLKNIMGLGVAIGLIAASASASAQEHLIKKGAEATKNAVVKSADVVADKTKEGLSKTGEVMTDGWITSRVHERFVDESLLTHSDISVDTDHHVVTLKGTVMTSAGRRKAASVALGTEGVHRVINRLTVGPKKD